MATIFRPCPKRLATPSSACVSPSSLNSHNWSTTHSPTCRGCDAISSPITGNGCSSSRTTARMPGGCEGREEVVGSAASVGEMAPCRHIAVSVRHLYRRPRTSTSQYTSWLHNLTQRPPTDSAFARLSGSGMVADYTLACHPVPLQLSRPYPPDDHILVRVPLY